MSAPTPLSSSPCSWRRRNCGGSAGASTSRCSSAVSQGPHGGNPPAHPGSGGFYRRLPFRPGIFRRSPGDAVRSPAGPQGKDTGMPGRTGRGGTPPAPEGTVEREGKGAWPEGRACPLPFPGLGKTGVLPRIQQHHAGRGFALAGYGPVQPGGLGVRYLSRRDHFIFTCLPGNGTAPWRRNTLPACGMPLKPWGKYCGNRNKAVSDK